MKAIICMALFLATGLNAHAAYFRFLGGKAFSDEKGHQITMPNGTELDIADPKADPLAAQYTDPLTQKTYQLRISREDARAYFETDSSRFRAFFQSAITAVEKWNAQNPEGCVELPKRECILPGNEEDFRRSTLSTILMTCAPDPAPMIVRRSERGTFEEFKQACKDPGPPPPAPEGMWPAPIPDPVCTEAQAKILRANDEKKHAAYLATCPANDPNLSKLNLADEPKCLQLADKGHIRRIVVHATEGSPYASPRNLLCDYAKGDGYRDIPYHFIIARDRKTKQWKIFEGRSLKYQGAHVRANLNSDSIGIAIAGDFFPGGPSPAHPFATAEAPPAEAVQLVQSLVAQLKRQYPTIREIQGHGEALFAGDHCLKDCPGPGAQFVVNRLRDKFFSRGTK